MKTKKIIKFIFLQLIIILFLLEIFFRIAGVIRNKIYGSKADLEKESFVILCLGDSTTEGLRVEREYSYPSRLQGLLDSNIKDNQYVVINEGHSSMNSSQLLNRLDDYIETHKPNLVVVLIGMNDAWNLKESNIWMFENTGSWSQIGSRIKIILSNVRVYQFIKLLSVSKEPREPREPIVAPDDFYKEFQDRAKKYDKSIDEQKKLFDLLNHNIGQIIRISKRNGILVFLMTYQKEGLGGARGILNIVYESLNLPIVDNAALFQEAGKKGYNFISVDNYHPNELGYLSIAKNVFNRMVEEGLIQGNKLEIFDNR